MYKCEKEFIAYEFFAFFPLKICDLLKILQIKIKTTVCT